MDPTQIVWKQFSYPNGDITVTKYNGVAWNNLEGVISPWTTFLDHEVTFENHSGSPLICVNTLVGYNTNPGSSDCP